MPVKKKKIQVIVSEEEYKKFQEYAVSKGFSMSELLRHQARKLLDG
jgi:hypothetical protein